MSDPNPPEQPSFNQPAQPPQGDPTAPLPTGGPATPPGSPGDVPMPAVGSTPPASSASTGSPQSPQSPSGPESTPAAPPPPPHAPAAPAAPSSGGPSGLSSIPDPGQTSSSFFSALFDFSFTNFVTPILVRIVYLLATVALVVSWLVFLFAAFAQNVGSGITVLILGPIFLIIYLAVIRMTLEFYLSVVRMSIDIHQRLPQA